MIQLVVFIADIASAFFLRKSESVRNFQIAPPTICRMSERRNVGLEGVRVFTLRQGNNEARVTQDDKGDIKEITCQPQAHKSRQIEGEELAVRQALFAQIAQNRVAEINENQRDLYGIATA